MRGSLVIALAVLLLAPASARASGYEFEGIGTRHVSRAGAATADAKDWSAVYWNPAGLASAPRSVGVQVFGVWAFPRDSDSLSSLSSLGLAYGKDTLPATFVLGAAGAVVPVGESAALGLGVYTPLLQGLDFQETSTSGARTRFKGSATVLTTNVSLGVRLTESLLAGFGLDFLYGRIENMTEIRDMPTAALGGALTDLDGGYAGSGYGLESVLGLLWTPHPRLTLGLTARSGAEVIIRGEAHSFWRSTAFGTLGDEHSRFRYPVHHPPTLDTGLAWRASDAWTLTFDVHQTFWRCFTSAMTFDTAGTLLANTTNSYHWRDTWKARLGSSWRTGPKTELLAGYSYDRFAVDAASVDFATAVDVPMHRASVGWGQRWTDSFSTLLGAIGGYGERKVGPKRYALSGVQLMAESQLKF